jgi:hypothetical protein
MENKYICAHVVTNSCASKTCKYSTPHNRRHGNKVFCACATKVPSMMLVQSGKDN